MQDVMLDLETLGNNPQSAIIAIGAIKFNPETGELGDTFYRVVDAESSVSVGLKMDASTVMWWIKQGAGARGAFNVKGDSLTEALLALNDWMPEDPIVWGNGATFDNVILSSAYAASGVARPWKFWNDRCYRTLKSLFPQVELVRSGTHHNALDDAKSQAVHACEIFKEMRRGR